MKFDRTIKTASPAGFEWTSYVMDRGLRQIACGIEATYADADRAAAKSFDTYIRAVAGINS